MSKLNKKYYGRFRETNDGFKKSTVQMLGWDIFHDNNQNMFFSPQDPNLNQVLRPWGVLTIFANQESIRRFLVSPIIRIGSAKDNHVVINHPLVQPYHVRIHLTEQGVFALKYKKQIETFYNQIRISKPTIIKIPVDRPQVLIHIKLLKPKNPEIKPAFTPTLSDGFLQEGPHLCKITCDLCFHPLVQPVTLEPCEHSFCGGCLTKSFLETREVICPFCQKDYFRYVYNSELDDKTQQYLKQHPDQRPTPLRIKRQTESNQLRLQEQRRQMQLRLLRDNEVVSEVNDQSDDLFDSDGMIDSDHLINLRQKCFQIQSDSDDDDDDDHKITDKDIEALIQRIRSQGQPRVNAINLFAESEDSSTDNSTSTDESQHFFMSRFPDLSDSDISSQISSSTEDNIPKCALCESYGRRSDERPKKFFQQDLSDVLYGRLTIRHFNFFEEEFRLFQIASPHPTLRKMFVFMCREYILKGKFFYYEDDSLYANGRPLQMVPKVRITQDTVNFYNIKYLCPAEFRGRLITNLLIRYMILNGENILYVIGRPNCKDGLFCQHKIGPDAKMHQRRYNHMVQRQQ